jgi:hypothetical protein
MKRGIDHQLSRLLAPKFSAGNAFLFDFAEAEVTTRGTI